MNIQIFGTKKSSDTRKAERFFKERGIKFQFIDMKEKELSKGEFNSVMQAVGGVDAMMSSVSRLSGTDVKLQSDTCRMSGRHGSDQRSRFTGCPGSSADSVPRLRLPRNTP